jgi:hypothetical protein
MNGVKILRNRYIIILYDTLILPVYSDIFTDLRSFTNKKSFERCTRDQKSNQLLIKIVIMCVVGKPRLF